MSKERQRRRAAAEAEKRQKAKTAERRAKVEKRVANPKPGPKRQPVYRQRRFPPLPLWLKLTLALLWLTVAVLVFLFVPSWTARIGFLVIATMLLPLIVVIVRDPTRRTRR